MENESNAGLLILVFKSLSHNLRIFFPEMALILYFPLPPKDRAIWDYDVSFSLCLLLI